MHNEESVTNSILSFINSVSKVKEGYPVNKIVNLFEHTSMTLDDMVYFCRKHNLHYTLNNENLTVTDGKNVIKFTTVMDDDVLNIFDYEY